MRLYKAVVALLATVVVASCDKNAVQDITGPIDSARIKFFNFGVNAPGVNFYANTTKMTAISSTTGSESTNGVTYGSVGSGGLYASIAPGQYAFTGKIAATVDKDLAVATINGTVADGKSYSLYLSGFYSTANKSVEGFLVQDDYPATIDFNVAYVRFVNAISNANPMTLYAKSSTTATETAIGGAIAYKAGGAFVSIPGGSYDLSTRYAGSSTNAITLPPTRNQRSTPKPATVPPLGKVEAPASEASKRASPASMG